MMDAEAEDLESFDLAENIGYHSNPEWYFERKKNEKSKHVNSQFEQALQAQKMGINPDSDIVTL